MNKKLLAVAGLAVLAILLLIAFVINKKPTESNKQTSVKIAIILPQTGPQAAVGIGGANSAKLAFLEKEKELEEKGVKIELAVLDDASKPETAVQQAQKVTSDNSYVLAIAHFNTPCALATVGLFHQAGMPIIVPAAVGSKVTADGYPEVVRTCNTDIGQAKYMTKFLIEQLKAKQIIVVDDGSSFGTGLSNALKGQLGSVGINDVEALSFRVGDVDFSPILSRIQSSSPDVVVIACMAAEGALFRKQMVEKQVNIPLIGFSGIFYETFLNAAGASAEGTMAIFPLPPLESLPGGKHFIEEYKTAGFSDPFESAGPFLYVAGQIASQVIENGATTRKEIMESLRKNTFNTAFGEIGFDQNGDMKLQMFSFYVVENGKWKNTHLVDKNGNIASIPQ